MKLKQVVSICMVLGSCSLHAMKKSPSQQNYRQDSFFDENYLKNEVQTIQPETPITDRLAKLSAQNYQSMTLDDAKNFRQKNRSAIVKNSLSLRKRFLRLFKLQSSVQ